MNVVCPICYAQDLQTFNTRPFARCSGCGSMERGRLAWVVLSRLGCLRRGANVLNFAPEPFMLTHGRRIIGQGYDCTDYSPEQYGAKASLVRRLDLCRDLANQNQAFYDAVVHNHVLEHVPCHAPTVLRGIDNLIRPGGWHIFSIPIFPNRSSDEDFSPSLSDEERVRRFGQKDHVRVFGRDFMALMIESGLVERLLDLSSLVSSEELARWAIPQEAISGASPHRVFAAQRA